MLTSRHLTCFLSPTQALRCECTDAEGPQCRVGDQSGRCRLRNECIGRQAESTDSCLGPADVVMCSLGD